MLNRNGYDKSVLPHYCKIDMLSQESLINIIRNTMSSVP